VGGLKHQKEKRSSIGIRYPGFSMRQVLARRRDYERSRRRTREDFFVSLPVAWRGSMKIGCDNGRLSEVIRCLLCLAAPT
jgi:hypothetical protein